MGNRRHHERVIFVRVPPLLDAQSHFSGQIHHTSARAPTLGDRIFSFAVTDHERPSDFIQDSYRTHRDRHKKYICSISWTGPMRLFKKSPKIVENRQKSRKSHDFTIRRVTPWVCQIHEPSSEHFWVPGRHPRPSPFRELQKPYEICIFPWCLLF